MVPTVRYPAGPITPHGAYYLLKGDHPTVKLRSYNDAIVFAMMGGEAISDPTMPEQVALTSIKGLIPPWHVIDQQGAVEDGTTFVDALYEPLEVELGVVARGRNARQLRRVVHDLIDSLDVKQQSELSWWTQEMGRWWANIRWFKNPADTMSVGGQRRKQKLTLVVRADNGFWRTYDDVASFAFAYEDMTDTFTTDYPTDLGPNWPQYYTGPGGGFCHADNDQARWVDDPDNFFFTNPKEVVNGPYDDGVFSETATNNQVINLVFGSIPEFSFPDQAEEHIWGRMGRNIDGTWNGYGVRLRLGYAICRLSYYINFTEHVIRDSPLSMLIPPLPGEKFTLICGYEGNERIFKVLRSGAEIMTVVESGTASPLGAAYRGIGFGMHAGASLITQATPANVRKISAGDNTTVTQTGFIPRCNVGDQIMHDRFTLYGPGLFRIGNGIPGDAGDYVEFGPLLPNQIMWIDSNPRHPRVVDMTSVAPTQQELNDFQKALQDFISFATANNVPPLLQQIESAFGILPPQGNPYSLMKGRFTKGVSPKLPGKAAEPRGLWVSIDDGNASSKIIAAGTPLRRWPQ